MHPLNVIIELGKDAKSTGLKVAGKQDIHLASKMHPTYYLLITMGNGTFIMERCCRHTHTCLYTYMYKYIT